MLFWFSIWYSPRPWPEPALHPAHLTSSALIGGSTLALAAQTAFAQTPMPMEEDPLDDRSRKRLDRMEKVVRELRAIVFQGRDTGQPVVVQLLTMSLGEEQNADQLLDQVAQPLMSVARMPAAVE